MKFMSMAKDGGSQSTVTGYWLVEIKWLFTIVLLRFNEGSRDAYHSHAFNAVSWYLSGETKEYILGGGSKFWRPSILPKYTPRECFHKVYATRTSWVLSFRGTWARSWREYTPGDGKLHTLTHGRKIV